MLLPGVGDLRTLDTVSRLAGQGDVAVRSVTTSAWWSGRPSASSTRRQERLPVDQVHSLAPGTALVIAGGRPPQLAALTPWWGYAPFWEAIRARPPALLPVTTGTTASGGPNRAPLSPPPLPPPPPPGAPKPSGDLPVSWRRVPGQRRAQPPPPRL